MNTSIATKVTMAHAYTSSGKRVPLTKLSLASAKVAGVNADASRVSVVYGKRKSVAKPQQKILEKAGITENYKYSKQFVIQNGESTEIGAPVTFNIFEPGDIVNVESRTKGKGFTSVVKLWGFKGGPRTHGQSDRHRAPGAISSGQTLGRVFKGKKMARRAGYDKQTVKNLHVLHVDNATGSIWLSGSVPGARNTTVFITKTGHNQKLEALQLPQIESSENNEQTK